MAESLGYLLAQPFQIASMQTMATTDDRGGPDNRNLASSWFRVLLASGAGASHVDAAELLAAVESALGATKWSVAMSTAGKVTFTYLGTGTGTITFSSAATLQAILGLTGNVGPLATNATATATYQPTHCLFAAACDPDTGWTDQAARFAGAAMPDGTVYGWHDGRAALRRAATYRLLPKNSAFVTSLGSSGTPAYPVASRWLSPSTSEPAQAPPWSALDTLATAYGLECAAVWGDLQDVLAGLATAYERVYLAPEMATVGRIALSIPGYDARRDVSLELLYAGAGSL